MNKENLEIGTIVQDSLMKKDWTIVKTNPVVAKMNDASHLALEITKENIGNFSLVSIPVKKDDEKKMFEIFVDNNGFLVDVTGKNICNQGQLRFNSKVFFDVENQKCLVAESISGRGYDSKSNLYMYDMAKDKFKLLCANTNNLFASIKLKTPRYVIDYVAETGTYGDFRRGYFSVYNRKTNSILNLGGILGNSIRRVELVKETSSMLSLLLYAFNSTGMRSGNSGFVVLCTIDTKNGTFFCKHKTLIPGNVDKANATILKNCIVCFDHLYVTGTSLNDSDDVFSHELTKTTIAELVNAKNVTKISITNSGKTIFLDNDRIIKIKKTTDRGFIQEVV